MSFYEILLILSAIPLGIVSGIFPVIGVTLIMITFYVFLSSFSFAAIILFWIVLKISDQFGNNVSTLYFGVSVDMSSIPLLKERQKLISEKIIDKAYYVVSASSVIGTTISVLILFFLLNVNLNTSIFLRTESIFILICLFFIGSIFWKENKIITNVILITLGCILGSVGYNQLLEMKILTFNYIPLYSGIPLIPTIVGLYVVPLLLFAEKLNFDDCTNKIKESNYKIMNTFVFLSTLFGSVIGFFVGLIPLVGSTLAPNISAYLTNKMSSSSIYKIAASESANSAAAISILLPLLTLAIAIQPSEAILLSILYDKGWGVYNVDVGFLIIIIIICVITSIINYLICSKIIQKYVMTIKQNTFNIMLIILFFIILGNVYFLGSMINKEMFYCVIFIIFSLFGIYLKIKNISVVPLIFSFIAIEYFFPLIMRLYQLYI